MLYCVFKRDFEIFDELRKIRNAINYYGRKVRKEESEEIINDLNILIKKFKGN